MHSRASQSPFLLNSEQHILSAYSRNSIQAPLLSVNGRLRLNMTRFQPKGSLFPDQVILFSHTTEVVPAFDVYTRGAGH